MDQLWFVCLLLVGSVSVSVPMRTEWEMSVVN